jgi:outer membrane protein assembly factor BamB
MRLSPARTPLVLAAVVTPLLTATLWASPSHRDAPDDATPTQFRGGAAHTGVLSTRGLGSYGGILWHVQLPGPVRSTPLVADGVVYVGSAGGFLHALDRRTGDEVWRYRTDAPAHGSPAVVGQRVFITDMAGTLHAVDRASGTRLWAVRGGAVMPWPWGHESGDVFASSPTVAVVDGTERVFWGGADGVLRAADAATGNLLWTLPTQGRIRATPAVAGDRLVVGSTDGMVYCADVRTGAVLWRFETRGATLFSGDFGFDRRSVQSSPAIADGRVHFGARDGWFYTLDLADGRQLWDYDHEVSWSNGSPAVSGNRVFEASSDARFIHALDASGGQEIWRVMTDNVVWTSPVVTDSTVYFSAGDGVVRALSVSDGSPRWEVALPYASHGSPTIDDGVLFVGTEDGGVYALRDGDGRPFHRAVFWDSTTAAAGWYGGGQQLAGTLSRMRYQILDTAALSAWMADRVRDREPSAVVYAQSWLPPSVADGGEASLFRRYLDAGGTVVWAALPPDVWRRDPSTGSPGGLDQVVWERPERILGISVEGAIFDRLGAFTTAEGLRLGLPEQWISNWDVPAQAGLEPLAIDENGGYAAFRKSYGGPPGTGFARIWGSSTPAPFWAPFLLAAESRPAAVPRGAPDQQ